MKRIVKKSSGKKTSAKSLSGCSKKSLTKKSGQSKNKKKKTDKKPARRVSVLANDETSNKISSQIQKSDDENSIINTIREDQARKAVQMAQKSTLDIIRAAAQRIEAEKNRNNDDDENDFMNVMNRRRRGRPPKRARSTKQDSHIYQPEYDGLMEERAVFDDEDDIGNDNFISDNETIDFWTDDDIPTAKGFKEGILDF